MNTTIESKSQDMHLSKKAKSEVANAKLSPFWEMMERNRFGVIPLVLIIVACLSGFAAAKGIDHSIFQLAIVAVPAMLTLSLLLAVAPMKAIIYSGVVSTLVNMVIFFI